MEYQYEKLFSPIRINGMTLKNRIMFPPMAMNLDHTSGEASEETIEFFARLARGGAAILVTNTMYTSTLGNRPTPATLAVHQKPMTVAPDRIDMRKQMSRVAWVPLEPVSALNPKLFNLVEAVHVNGSRLCGALSPTPLGWILRNYDITNLEYQGLGLFNKMATAEAEETIEEFALVAGELKNLGFDAIEINFSYFPDHFAHESFNKRTDKYGPESLETRLRYHQELIQAARAEVGSDFPLMSLIDVDHYGARGWRTLEESKTIVKKFEEWGINCVRARGGGSVKVQYDIAPMYIPKGVNIPLAAGIKEVLNVPVAVSTRMTDPDMDEQVLREGKADMIAIGRGLIADPDLPKKVMSGRADRVRKCIACNIGCFGNLTLLPRRSSRCTVNPFFGREYKLPDFVEPAAEKKRLVIVGAGPGGMSAALTACQRGHEVVLFEKSPGLGEGGQFKLATIAPFKQENLLIPEYYGKELTELKNLTVHLNTEADADRVMAEKPDAVIIATGGCPLIPDFPGTDGPQVISYQDTLLEQKPVGDRVVIIGGGNIGCEVALYLLNKGKRVTILEQLYRLADAVEIATRNCMMEELERAGAGMIASARATAISGNEVSYLKDGKKMKVPGDSIVLAIGSQCENRLYEDLKSKMMPNLHIIGDAKEPRQIMHAITEGFYTAYYLLQKL